MAYITEANFEARYGIDIGASTVPTTTEFATWITDATAEVNHYLHVTTDVTDSDGIILKIVAAMLYRKYLVFRATKSNDMATVASILEGFVALGITDPLDMTAQEQNKLDMLTASVGNRRTSYVFNINTGDQIW